MLKQINKSIMTENIKQQIYSLKIKLLWKTITLEQFEENYNALINGIVIIPIDMLVFPIPIILN